MLRKLLIVALALLILLAYVYDLTHLNRFEVAMLSLKGEHIILGDFLCLKGEDIGSGFHIKEYPIDDSYCLRVATGYEFAPFERPIYVYWVNLEDGTFIDLIDVDFWDILFG